MIEHCGIRLRKLNIISVISLAQAKYRSNTGGWYGMQISYDLYRQIKANLLSMFRVKTMSTIKYEMYFFSMHMWYANDHNV